MTKKIIHAVVKISVAVILTAVLFIVGAKAPELHTQFLRDKVGSVVIKIVTNNTAVAGGTGFHVVAPSGKVYILTNAHVCKLETEEGTMALVAVPNSNRFVSRRIIEVSSNHDLCLVEALNDMPGVKLADEVQIGDAVRAVGHPLLRPLRVSLGKILDNTSIDLPVDVGISKEECTKLNGNLIFNAYFNVAICFKPFTAVETDVIIFPGSSGSPVVNFWGHLVGVIFASDTRTHYGFMVPLKEVKEFLKIH